MFFNPDFWSQLSFIYYFNVLLLNFQKECDLEKLVFHQTICVIFTIIQGYFDTLLAEVQNFPEKMILTDLKKQKTCWHIVSQI